MRLLLRGAGVLAATGLALPAAAAPVSAGIAFDTHIVVDQFGYRPADPKVAVLRDPQLGYDRTARYAPAPAYQVRRSADGVSVFSAAPVAWNRGATEASSGDRGWTFDFSSVTTPGSYFVFDPRNNLRSAAFQVADDVYKPVLKAAVRMYFYQRSGVAKRLPYAQECWVDAPSYVGLDQDTQAHDVTDRDNPARIRDLSGGWFDAGDTNKYVTFAAPAVHQLLSAYLEHPAAFTDDFGIPESGNGVPDVLDEVKWETDWLKRMQFPDGSVALKVGDIVNAPASPPSSDASPRYYVPACTSATIAAAGMFAHAAYVFGTIPALAAEAADLRGRATAAWHNFQSAPARQTHCDSGVVKSGNADWNEQDQVAESVVAAVYLFAVTRDTEYSHYVGQHLRDTRPYRDFGWSRYQAQHGEALLFFTTLPGADPQLSQGILAAKRADIAASHEVYGSSAALDLYRSFLHDPQYHWGSNQVRANYGNANVDVLTYRLDRGDPATFASRALDTLHYFHGVNPFGMVYLSNMGRYGATLSADEIYHSWFAAGSRWSDARQSPCGPAPGYLPGGPNADAAHEGVPATLQPPSGQPPQKSYRAWNAGWPQSSWVVNEPGIYYQAAYVKLLSAFAR